MFLVVFGIVGMNYGPYVLWPVVWPQTTMLSTICIGIFHVLVFLLLASYVMCVFTDPGTVPLAWHQMIEASPMLASEHRFCNRSKKYRPLRSHFCSITRRVVLNMDHFCPCALRRPAKPCAAVVTLLSRHPCTATLARATLRRFATLRHSATLG